MLHVKMNMFLNGILLLLLAAFSVPQTEAAVSRGEFKDAAHPGKCYVKPNLIMNLGETAKYPDMDCARISCEENSMAQIHSCGKLMPDPLCVFDTRIDPNADYPDCCERYLICA